MVMLASYGIAVLFCVITMFCWGSWGNTQKLVGKTWRYELFYWDYVFGVVLAALVFGLTMGSHGQYGMSFCESLKQASRESLLWAFAGGVVFNIANILLVAAIAVAGMAVAFPVGIGLALVLGVLVNYLGDPAAAGKPYILFPGIALVTYAIILNAKAYSKLPKTADTSMGKGLTLSILCGILMSLFYFFVAQSITGVEGASDSALTLANLQQEGAHLQAGKMTPYAANFVFSIGILVSNFIVMPILMKKPIVGTPVAMGAYFSGRASDHLWGIIGGIIWAIGMTLNVVASGVASPAIAYGLGQGATLMSAIWGVFIWREFRDAPKGTTKYLVAMFLAFIVGLGLIIWTKL